MYRVIGHRGAAAVEPENTVRSFARAQRDDADEVELDVRLSGDGRVMILHDATVDRTTDGHGPLADQTFAELRRLDAGKGERIPTFDEALDATDLPLQVEIKAFEAIEPLVRTIRDRAVARRVTLTSFSDEALRRVRELLPDVPRGLITSGAPSDAADRAEAVGAGFVALRLRAMTADVVARCRAQRLGVFCWMVDNDAEFTRSVALGCDGGTTDDPAALRAAVRRLDEQGRGAGAPSRG